jgi:hypothetical protein
VLSFVWLWAWRSIHRQPNIKSRCDCIPGSNFLSARLLRLQRRRKTLESCLRRARKLSATDVEQLAEFFDIERLLPQTSLCVSTVLRASFEMLYRELPHISGAMSNRRRRIVFVHDLASSLLCVRLTTAGSIPWSFFRAVGRRMIYFVRCMMEADHRTSLKALPTTDFCGAVNHDPSTFYFSFAVMVRLEASIFSKTSMGKQDSKSANGLS